MIVQLWKKNRKDGGETFASIQSHHDGGLIIYYEETNTISSPAPLAKLEQTLQLAGYEYLTTQEIF